MSTLHSGGGNRLNPKLQSGEIPLLWMRAEASLKGLQLKPSVVMWKIEGLDKPITPPLNLRWWLLEILPFQRLCYNNTSRTTSRWDTSWSHATRHLTPHFVVHIWEVPVRSCEARRCMFRHCSKAVTSLAQGFIVVLKRGPPPSSGMIQECMTVSSNCLPRGKWIYSIVVQCRAFSPPCIYGEPTWMLLTGWHSWQALVSLPCYALQGSS